MAVMAESLDCSCLLNTNSALSHLSTQAIGKVSVRQFSSVKGNGNENRAVENIKYYTDHMLLGTQ